MKTLSLLYVALLLFASNCKIKQTSNVMSQCDECIEIISHTKAMSLVDYKYVINEDQLTFSSTQQFIRGKDFYEKFIVDSVHTISKGDLSYLEEQLQKIITLPDTNMYIKSMYDYTSPSSLLKIVNINLEINSIFIDYIPESVLPFILKMKELTNSEEFDYWAKNAIPDSVYYKEVNVKN